MHVSEARNVLTKGRKYQSSAVMEHKRVLSLLWGLEALLVNENVWALKDLPMAPGTPTELPCFFPGTNREGGSHPPTQFERRSETSSQHAHGMAPSGGHFPGTWLPRPMIQPPSC